MECNKVLYYGHAIRDYAGAECLHYITSMLTYILVQNCRLVFWIAPCASNNATSRMNIVAACSLSTVVQAGLMYPYGMALTALATVAQLPLV